ncbi:MAG: hypothetical protein KAH56_02630 [Candidatus Krumholzibacteria bacterium]|nr:hypothetical protein [Candidatus Krumholzibacteria bacterium]
MKKLVVLLLASLVATSAFAVIDEDPDMIGIYFDMNADSNCLTTPTNTPFMAYLVATNPTPALINAYEFGYRLDVPVGMEGMLFRMADTSAGTGAVDVGDSSNLLEGDYVIGLAAAIPTTAATVLHSWNYMVLAVFPVEMYIYQSVKPSVPGTFPVLQNADGSILYTAGQSTGGWEFPVATVNTDCVVGVEDASFGSVKSLFR